MAREFCAAGQICVPGFWHPHSHQVRDWSQQEALRLAVQACATAGLDDQIEQAPFSTNGVFKVGELCLRVCRPLTISVEAVRIHRLVAQCLDEHGIPSLRPAPIEPFEIAGAACGFWHWEDHDRSRVIGPYERGCLLARVHAALRTLPAQPRIADWSSPLRALERLASALPHPLLTAEDVAQIVDSYGRLLSQLREHPPALPTQTIHGDLSPSNIIFTDRGWTVIDLDDVSYGQPEWDLIRNYSADEYRQFAAGYGFDITSWDGFATLAWLQWLGGMIWGLRQDLAVPGFRTQDAAAEELDWWRQQGRARLAAGALPWQR